MNYKPSSYVPIDKQPVGLMGNCPFRIYVPNKPIKYGMVCDISTKYMLNAEQYLYKSTVSTKQPLADNFVEKLVVATISGSTLNNLFASIPLDEHLLEKSKLITVGTIRKNKRELPSEEFKDPNYKGP